MYLCKLNISKVLDREKTLLDEFLTCCELSQTHKLER